MDDNTIRYYVYYIAQHPTGTEEGVWAHDATTMPTMDVARHHIPNMSDAYILYSMPLSDLR